MNEQQLQQILTIQQAIAAAATAAVINSLLNPQQAAANLTNQNPDNNSLNNADPQDLQQQLQQLQQLQHHLQQQQQQQQHQHKQQHQLQQRTDSRLDSPVATSSPVPANNHHQIDTSNRTIQDLLMQLQQQAAANIPANNSSNNLQLPALANSSLSALNLNLNNPLAAQPSLNNSSISRLLGNQNDFNLASLAAQTSSNIQQSNRSPSSNSNKKLKRQHHQPQPNPQSSSQHNRTSLDATSKSLQQNSSPKSHSTISNLANRNNSGSTNTSTSSAFLPNNVGLPRKLVRGQDVWLGRGAEQTRQILKCMWCGQSFRTLAEMTQHMKVTQHYTNIISQEQITSWRQPDGMEVTPGKSLGKQSNSSKSLDEAIDTSSEKFNDSDRDDSFSNDEEPQQSKRAKSKPASKAISQKKIKRESMGDTREASEQQDSAKPLTRSHKQEIDGDDASGNSSSHEESDAENSSASVSSSQQKRSNSNDVLRGNDEDNKSEDASSPLAQVGTDSGDGQTEDSAIQKEVSNFTEDTKRNVDPKNHGESITSPGSKSDDKDANYDEPGDSDHDVDDERQSGNDLDATVGNDDDCDKVSRKNPKEKSSDIDPSTCLKQISDAQKGDNSGDPLSALETMVEKSFDPRMRPGMASGGILQRLGIDEEVCPPWQHINYANWYAAAAYGHPMAAALLAAGINLQNGIKLSKNINPKKNDE